MPHECELKDQAAQRTLSIRTRAPVRSLPEVLGQAYGAISQYLDGLGEHPAGAPFVAYHNMDMQALDIEIGVPVSRELAGRDTIQSAEIPAGTYAVCLYTGPYGGIASAYEALEQWIKDNGHEATGLAYEMYLNDPSHTLPQELLTQIAFLLKSA